jgi:hypothetical protein
VWPLAESASASMTSIARRVGGDFGVDSTMIASLPCLRIIDI